MTEIDIATMDSEAPTLYLGFGNVLHRGEASLDTLRRVTLESGGKPFGDTHHLLDALAPYPNLQIVLTTAWVWWVGDEEVVALLPPHSAKESQLRRVSFRLQLKRQRPVTVLSAQSFVTRLLAA